jgi:hypothetical protein
MRIDSTACLPGLTRLLFGILCCWPMSRAAAYQADGREALVASGDLHLVGPARQSEHGLPVGNGRMGSMVWTTPGAIHLQINRTDVYASDKDSTAFHECHENYCGGCAFVDLDFGKTAEIFTAGATRQDLSIYNGVATLTGERLAARIIAHPGNDVIAIEIADDREKPEVMRGLLRMLRQPVVRKSGHSATSELREENGSVVLTQEFKEGRFVCRTAVAVSFGGPEPAIGRENDQLMHLSAPAARRTTLYVASAATFDPGQDVAATALKLAAGAKTAGFEKLARETADWWHGFWQGSYLKLTGTDAKSTADAALVQAHYYYFLYLMGASSRGPLPPKFNGMLWNSRGDARMWGDMHWWHNVSCFYDALPATGKWELLDPVYDMYSAMLPSCGQAAKEAWGSEGVWIPETVHFNGLPELPTDIAAELREFLLCRQPVEKLSARFKDFASHRNPLHPYWNYLAFDCWKTGQFDFRTQGHGPFSYVTHIFSSGSKIAMLFWARYDHTRDIGWLRTRAYPVIRGAAEFYRNFPNLKLEADGRYHLHQVNNHEPTWGAQDPIGELAAMYGILPVAIRASEILGVDEDLRPKWRDLLARLAPLPTTDHPMAIHPRKPGENPKWDVGLKPVAMAGGGGNDAMIFFNLYTVETRDPGMAKLAAATYGEAPRSYKPWEVGPLGLNAVTSAHMGRGEDMGAAIVSQLTDPLVYPNRLCDVEGDAKLPGTSAEHEGRMTLGLLRGLLLAAPPKPGEEAVVRLFAALPAAWDAEYQLHAPGGFVVSAMRSGGVVRHVTAKSSLGGDLKLRNPWPGSNVKLLRNSNAGPSITGDILTLSTALNEEIHLTKE